MSGGIDLQHEKDGSISLVDWKSCSAYAVEHGKSDWEDQLNLYAHLVRRQKKVEVNKLQIGALIKDWQASKARFDPYYPQHPIQMIDVEVWDDDVCASRIETLVHEHEAARLRHDLAGELPDCTPSEMWQQGGSFAVKKLGAKRASAGVWMCKLIRYLYRFCLDCR